MTGVDILRRAGELPLYRRPPSKTARLTALMRRAAAEIERRRRADQRRTRVRRLAIAGFAVGTGAAVALARMGIPGRTP